MSKFKPNEFEVKAEGASSGFKQGHTGKVDPSDPRVVKVDKKAERVVEQFHFGKIAKGEESYSEIKRRYGALAVTDPERAARNQKDRRFSLNPLLRDPLSVEEEERRVIEERVRARVAAVAEEAKANASSVGYQEGLKKGYDEAFSRFRAEGEARLKRLDGLLAEAENAKEEIFRANERFLMEVVFRIGKMVLLKELSTDKEYVLRLTRDLLERIGVRENIKIRVHPDDLASMTMVRQGLESALGAMKNLNIEASNQVKLGGCLLETEWNAIDASIETQLKGVADSLLGGNGPQGGGSAQ